MAAFGREGGGRCSSEGTVAAYSWPSGTVTCQAHRDARQNPQRALDELQAWLRTTAAGIPGDVPSWSRVLLAVVSQVDGSSLNRLPTLASSRLFTPVAFERRWLELVGQGRHDWINLSAYGVWREILVVVVEPPTRGPEGGFAPDQISVMFSGPPLQSGWDLSSHLAIID